MTTIQQVSQAARTMAVGLALGSAPAVAANADDVAVHVFRANVPQAAVDDMRRRLLATRWPEKETVTDISQGPPLTQLKDLVGYWGSGYDWRKAEAQLNAFPQFTTRIDGVDIHFIHVRSKHKNALPVIISHGWPGSVFEQIKLIEPLVDPTRFGGRAEEAFDVVIPSLPGYGFSGKPTEPGWSSERIARAWEVLMTRLGLHALRRTGRRLGRGYRAGDGPARLIRTGRHPHQLPCDGAQRSRRCAWRRPLTRRTYRAKNAR